MLPACKTPRDVTDSLLAAFNKPSTEKSRYFCEACAVPVLACDLDWQMHLNGAGHQRQILSLREKGELGHRPQGELQIAPPTRQHTLHTLNTEDRLLWQVVISQHMWS